MTTDSPVVTAAKTFCDGFVARDWSRVAGAIGDDVVFGVGGTSPLAGEYQGRAAFVELVQRMVAMSGDTLRFSAGPDSYDVLVSNVHAAVLVPFSAERDGNSLEYSYQIWQFHAGPQLGGYGGLYVADQTAFDAFFSAT